MYAAIIGAVATVLASLITARWAVRREHDRFVRKGEILGALVAEYLHPDAWAQFQRLILDESLVMRMVEKSVAEQMEITREIFGQLGPLLGGGSGAGSDGPGQAPAPQPKGPRPPKRGGS